VSIVRLDALSSLDPQRVISFHMQFDSADRGI
jgi:hypothetical protein